MDRLGKVQRGPSMMKGLGSLACEVRIRELCLFSLRKRLRGNHLPVFKAWLQKRWRLPFYKEWHGKEVGWWIQGTTGCIPAGDNGSIFTKRAVSHWNILPQKWWILLKQTLMIQLDRVIGHAFAKSCWTRRSLRPLPNLALFYEYYDKWGSLGKYMPVSLTLILGKVMEHLMEKLINKEWREAYIMSCNMVYGQKNLSNYWGTHFLWVQRYEVKAAGFQKRITQN